MRKTEIEELLEKAEAETAEKAIEEYEKRNPDDLDILMMKTSLALIRENIDLAYHYAAEGVERLPLNGDMQYNYAVVCEEKGLLAEAYEAYIRADFIYRYTKDPRADELMAADHAADLLYQVEGSIGQMTREQAEAASAMIEEIIAMHDHHFGLLSTEFRSPDFSQIIGKYFYEDRKNRRYVGIFKDQYFAGDQIEKGNLDVMHLKAEFLTADQENGTVLGNEAKEYFLPIAAETEETTHIFHHPEFQVTTKQHVSKRFSYYRLPAGTGVESSEKSYYGNPIPIRHDPKRKRLVMSIFVDGLSYSILRGDAIRRNMPNVGAFFEKGLVFTEAYNTAEWTYPSIINYVSGLDTTHHMLFHHTLDYPLTRRVSTLAELFHDAGYYTAMYNGNWRIIPSYGHARGYDRFVYQHQKIGFKVQEVIADTINHLEAFREVDQYVWISIGDLHDVADKEIYPVYVQKGLTPEQLQFSEGGSTSVKQSYDGSFVAAYEQTARYIDFWLGMLFRYIRDNFPEEDYIISLFSDHGQGYLIREKDAHFLSEERSNIPMFFCGGDLSAGKCGETVSSSDYLPIMCKLAGIEDKDRKKRDGRLPHVLGGEASREYTITESIHPGDPYQAAIFTGAQGPVFYFVNPLPVRDDGRFALGEYSCSMKDRSGKEIPDESEKEKYLQILMQHIAPLRIYE